VNTIQLSRYGRYRSTLWTYAGCNTFRKGRMDDLEGHPTTKPRALISDFGADMIVVDDLMKAADASSAVERQRAKDYYEQTLLSRLNDKTEGASSSSSSACMMTTFPAISWRAGGSST
jgi:hypothetical protein